MLRETVYGAAAYKLVIADLPAPAPGTRMIAPRNQVSVEALAL
jgi:hypothetical protein